MEFAGESQVRCTWRVACAERYAASQGPELPEWGKHQHRSRPSAANRAFLTTRRPVNTKEGCPKKLS